MKPQKITKAMLYKDIQQEGYILPKLNSTVCNLAYLFKVRNGFEYCPLEVEVDQGITCENPPKRILLLVFIQEELEKRGDARTLSFDENHLPDVDWCLKALSALDPLHQIFDSDYRPPLNHRGRRGQRFIPSAEDLLFIQNENDIQNGNDMQNGNDVEQPPKCKSKNLQCKQDMKTKSHFQEEDKVAEMGVQNDLKDQKVGPLVQMLKELDERGLLQECMQHYIDIQGQYDNLNQQEQKKKAPIQKTCNQNSNATKKKGTFQSKLPFTQYKEEQDFKHKNVQFNWNNKKGQFTEVQSPSGSIQASGIKQSLKEELRQISINKLLQIESSYQKTSASSENKNYFKAEDPVMIKKKVRDFGTPESRNRHRKLDTIMNNENEKLMSISDANGVFQDATDKIDFQERADHDQPQNMKETPDPIFNI